MKQNGKNPRQFVIAVIPARYSSTRLPGKLLLPIAGKPLIIHTLERTLAAASVDRAVVATDDERILDAVLTAGGEAVMTSASHVSGSDRVAEVAQSFPTGTIVVNVQGDEPVISPETIDRAVDALLGEPAADIATASENIESLAELEDANVVKVVMNDVGRAIYFSRSPIPFPREASQIHGGPQAAVRNDERLLSVFRKHTGLYVYKREYLLRFTAMAPTGLEKIEMLEQLRAVENGAYIKVVEAAERSVGVDTFEDYERVRNLLEKNVFPSTQI